MADILDQQHGDSARLRLAVLIWVVFAIAVCLKTVSVGGEHSVYPQFIGSARHWWADMSLYADYTQSENMDGYRYSPAFAIAFTPFYLLPDRAGLIAWNLMSLGLLAWAMHVLLRDVLATPPWQASEGNFLILTLLGSAVGIWSGQSNAILPAMIAFAMAAIVKERWWTASFLLAIPVFIKIWPLAIVLLLLACWPRRLLGRFTVACLALALLPFLTKPPAIVLWQYQEWYDALTGPFQGRWGGYRDTWTIWEQLGAWVSCPADWSNPTQHRIYTVVQLTTALAVLIWCLQQRRRLMQSQPHGNAYVGNLLIRIFAMWTAWQLLFGPGTEQLTYGIIAPATSWAVLTCHFEHRATWPTLTAWGALALLPAGDVERSIVRVFPNGQMLLPLGVILFVVWLVWHEQQETASLGTDSNIIHMRHVSPS